MTLRVQQIGREYLFLNTSLALSLYFFLNDYRWPVHDLFIESMPVRDAYLWVDEESLVFLFVALCLRIECGFGAAPCLGFRLWAEEHLYRG